MVILCLGIFFVVVLLFLGWAIFPGVRTWLGNGIANSTERTAGWLRRGGRGLGRSTTAGASAARRGVTNAGRVAGDYRLMLVGLVLIVTFPSLAVMHMQGLLAFDDFQPSEEISNELVARLLRGEHLVPPEPPPPEVFTTRKVKLVRPHLARANREWSRLKPGFRRRLLAVYQVMQQKYGYNMVLIEGYRSPERQRKLLAMDSNVTNAGPYESYHQFGLAADSAFMRNGELVIAINNEWTMRGYQLYGKVAERFGLTWGGEWEIKDYGHVELRNSKYPDPTTYNP